MTNEVKTEEKPVEEAVSRLQNVERINLRPVTDVYRDEEALRILMDLPGASDDTIEVEIHDGQLSVRAEVTRSEQEIRIYERTFKVDRRMDTSQIEALLRCGVLHLRIPFHEEARPKRIAVRTAD